MNYGYENSQIYLETEFVSMKKNVLLLNKIKYPA